MHKVEKAIIMAAGLGNRMHPITLNTPKPLVKVNGIRMIDTVIKGLHINGIYEIYIVVGYLKEQFEALEDEYPGVKLISNPYFDTCNNISSLYVARNYIENAIILDGDQIIYNPAILAPEFKILAITVFGLKKKQMNGFKQLKMTLLYLAVVQVEDVVGNYLVFRVGQQKMEKN